MDSAKQKQKASHRYSKGRSLDGRRRCRPLASIQHTEIAKLLFFSVTVAGFREKCMEKRSNWRSRHLHRDTERKAQVGDNCSIRRALSKNAKEEPIGDSPKRMSRHATEGSEAALFLPRKEQPCLLVGTNLVSRVGTLF